MAELWDVYTEERVLTGRLQQRGLPIPEGAYHLVVNIWVVREDGRILLTRRDPRKPYGGWWETTGGSVVAGEDSLQGAIRETGEETGICLQGLHPIFLCSEKRKKRFSGYLAVLCGGQSCRYPAGGGDGGLPLGDPGGV